ncbi:MAG: ATP-binding protein [Cupriavidus sp.]|nr:ATP-binding protein [Cupriavidus sp.]
MIGAENAAALRKIRPRWLAGVAMATPVERLGALTVGRIEIVTAQELSVSLFGETPQATALNSGIPTGFPRINAYVLVPNETGAVVGVVKEISIVKQALKREGGRSDGIIDLPFPARLLTAIPFGTLTREDGPGRKFSYKLERGVPVLPSVGDPVVLPTPDQLRCIVEAEEKDRIVELGVAPFAGDATVWIHPDRIFGRHLAILGNTGSGKSCSVAGIVRWSLEAAKRRLKAGEGPNARFIILDPNGEYSEAFKDGSIPARRYAVGGKDGARPLTVPGWLWTGQEWAAFTAAQGGVQRPILLRALRSLRNESDSGQVVADQAVRRYQGYLHQYRQLHVEVPQSIASFPANRNFGESLRGLADLMRNDVATLGAVAPPPAALIAAIGTAIPEIDRIRGLREYQAGRFNDYQPADLMAAITAIENIVNNFPISAGFGEISEDAPVKFDISKLPDRIRDIAQATGGQALANVEPLMNRIQVLLGDRRLRPVIETDGVESLEAWLNELLAPTNDNPEALAIVDLSLVPSDVVHVAVGVITRLIFEALQRQLKADRDALPTVIVLEEAHTFVRKEADQGASQAAAEVCRQVFERVAREGRKFGLGLVLASQRPSELSPTVLAQCNSFLLHRIVNDVDQNLVRRLVPDALGGLLGELPTLPSQQAILLGWAVPTPVLVRIRDLEQRPRSSDPEFWDTWTRKKGSPPDWALVANEWERGDTPVEPAIPAAPGSVFD